MGLEAYLHAVFGDDLGCDVFFRFQIANGDRIARGPTLQGESLQGDGERAVDGGDLDEVPLAHQRAAGDVAPGEDPARRHAAAKVKSRSATSAGSTSCSRRKSTRRTSSAAGSTHRHDSPAGGDPGIAHELQAEQDGGIARRGTGRFQADAQQQRRGGLGRKFGDHQGDGRGRRAGSTQGGTTQAADLPPS